MVRLIAIVVLVLTHSAPAQKRHLPRRPDDVRDRLGPAVPGSICAQLATGCPDQPGGTLPNPILFVTQVPIPADFTTIGSTFGNHRATMQSAGRGGDLYILYPDGSLRNLTQEAGYGEAGLQGPGAIAVREPSVHWDGNKAVFSMVVGAPAQYVYNAYRWQLYEVTGLAAGDTAIITKVPNQPVDFNNVAPIYATDDRIIFASDRPRDGQLHLYPQLDEYEEAPTVSGLWSLDPATGQLFLMNHSPSGVFSPEIDSAGRVVFTRWDHLQRDQQADSGHAGGYDYGTFNYSSEAADSVPTGNDDEVFPEPRGQWINFVNDNPGYVGPVHGYEAHLEGHTLNHFFPWQINEDGTEEETLGHVGRHELHSYFNRSFNDDSNLVEQIGPAPLVDNTNTILNFFYPVEDPADSGRYLGIDAPEFTTHGAGQVVALRAGGIDPDRMIVDYLTHPDTAGTTPTPDHTGLYRNPVPLSDGTTIVVHTNTAAEDDNEGTRALPQSRYDFRIRTLVQQGAYATAGTALTPGIEKTVMYYDPDVLVTYSGPMWELDPAEVRARPRPVPATPSLPAPESQILQEEDVDPATLKAFLEANDLALLVSRNVTTRDGNDRQQPFNLRVAGTSTQTVGIPGTLYDVAYMQFFQGDLIRGLTFGGTEPRPGRRVLAQVLHDPQAANPPLPGAPQGSVRIADDGSMAALVPARRAMSWQLTDDAGNAVVRERYWLTFQPGEIRSCTSCHGLNTQDQAGQPPPANPPEALRELLQFLKNEGAL